MWGDPGSMLGDACDNWYSPSSCESSEINPPIRTGSLPSPQRRSLVTTQSTDHPKPPGPHALAEDAAGGFYLFSDPKDFAKEGVLDDWFGETLAKSQTTSDPGDLPDLSVHVTAHSQHYSALLTFFEATPETIGDTPRAAAGESTHATTWILCR